MKKTIILLALFSIAFLPAIAQDSSVRGQALNGSTGLYTLPTGHIGWDTSDFGLDFGYRGIFNDEIHHHRYQTTHIPSVTISLFKMLEFSFAYDIQPDPKGAGDNYDNNDVLLGFKLKLPTGATAISLGLNYNMINDYRWADKDYSTFQPYIAITYPGSFFKMPAETTVFVGKTFYEREHHKRYRKNNSDIDFGMGFDLSFLPDLFGGFVHLIVDFSNFAYSSDPFPENLVYRGVFNAGFRFDFGRFPVFEKFKFVLDVAFNDILDDGQRSFTFGGVFGIPLM